MSLSAWTLRLFGWRVDPVVTDVRRCVLIGAFHTSNWDFPLVMLGMFATRFHFDWVAKHTLFRWPLGAFMRALGGVPVDRAAGAGFVSTAVETFARRDRFVLAISPEGTRSYTPHWTTGFYRIALGAGVPVALGYIDHSRRRLGIGPVLMPTGDIERDFEAYRAFYADKTGRYREKQGVIAAPPSSSRPPDGPAGKTWIDNGEKR